MRALRNFVAPFFDIVDGFVEQDLVGLLGVLGDWVLILLAMEPAAAGK